MSDIALVTYSNEYQCWRVEYHDSTRGGAAQSWHLCRTEGEARAQAREYNFAQPLGPWETTLVTRIRTRCSLAFELTVDYPFFYENETAPDKDNRLAMDHYLVELYRIEQAVHPKWSENEIIDLLIYG